MHANVGARTTVTLALVRDSLSDGVVSTRDVAEFRAERESAGTHLIIDFWGARRLGDVDFIEATMRRGVEAAGATLLHVHLHHFGPGCGVTGVAVLAESHISVHTWPERGFAAFDVFMCGASKPARAVEVLTEAFAPRTIKVSEVLRGVC